MDEFLKKQLCDNSLTYKRSLARIIDKYSKLQYQDGGIEVDLDDMKPQTLEHYMKLSKTELNKLESKSLTDLRDDSLRAQDITRDSQLDITHQDSGADETCVSSISSISTTQLSVEDDGMARSDTTQLTVSSLDQSQRSLSETEFQPEDQDEELEMSLRSHGSSLVELYPSMISRIGRAWHRQHVSEAADSVLRRYRRWRQQSNKSYLNNTFIVMPRQASSNSRKMTSKTLLKENSDSRVKSPFMRTETTARSPLQIVNNLQDWQAQPQSPGRVIGSVRREQHQPILVMDLSETSKQKEISLNETFTVSQLSPPEVSQLGEQTSTYAVSPSRPCYPSAKASLDMSLRSKRFSLAVRSPQSDGCSMYASETTAVKDMPDIYGSPLRQSPLKARMMTSLSRSPLAFSRSPKANSVESFSSEPMRPRLTSTSLSSPLQKRPVPLRMLNPHRDSHHSFQSQLHSPQSAAAAEGRHRLRRHLSFDSSLPSIRVSYSPKKLDEDFIKLYHKFVCQNKSSFFNGHPCRFCARSSEASRGHSSSALAALALSPHRSVLRKRHRELCWESHPQSKRFRDEYSTSSPGSKRHGNEMLRRRICPSEYEQSHDDRSYSPSKHETFQSTHNRSAGAHQETWMSQGRHVSAAEFSALGGSLKSKMANGYSPSMYRKW
ncbi:uncharacterized protein si:dkeyp-117h8.4 isoform X1 [Micropterus salmoides]|uniref:uncharacterized protein si:dkeyp-117h8.4 isoform X1 n=1 Tax=Micropterus salmoides TaxID=27706 RepID=UPI0018EA5D67|nr:uncharacterized protein si:dkeyp-117h8.4 isoform X1 [Micropterus salmoides]